MLSLRTVRAEQRVSRLAIGTDAPGGPCMSRHTPTERIGIFAVCTNLPILFSCLSPMPPGGDKPPPLRQRRGCGANIHGDARIRPGAAGILRRFQLLRMTPLPVPDCGQHGTTSPDGEAKASHRASPSGGSSREAGDEGECRITTSSGKRGSRRHSPSPVSCADILPRWGRNIPFRHHRKLRRHLPLQGRPLCRPLSPGGASPLPNTRSCAPQSRQTARSP